MQIKHPPPLGLYIHMPWCEKKCPYCDFNSHTIDQLPEFDYIDALLNDLEQDLPLVWGRRVETIFIGGGTPSLFSGEAIDRLFSGLRALLNISANAEVTLESNPGSADIEHFRAYREIGINRLSIGIQSFNDDHLRALGRVHDASLGLQAFASARQAGFDNINLDLMYGLPAQSVPQAVADLQQAIALGPEHISHYQLTIEPNTLFHSRPPAAMPDDDLAWEQQSVCQTLLSDQRYQQYEISAYSLDNFQSRHNLNYWKFGDYLGIGAGAHGKITLAGENRILRRVRQRQTIFVLDGQTHRLTKSRRRRKRPRRMNLFVSCRRAMTPSSAKEVRGCREARSSALRSPAPFLRMRQYYYWTRPPVLSMQKANDWFKKRWNFWKKIAQRSSSPIGWRRC